MSAGVPSRPSGCCDASSSLSESFIHPVSIGPGFTTFAEMLRGPNSLQCGPAGSPYLGVDPFETALTHTSSILFLTQTTDGWQAITPAQGIIEADAHGAIPRKWPSPSPIPSP